MIFFLFIAALIAPMGAPLGLDWGTRTDDVPEIQKYRYWYGDAAWGTMIYSGTEDIIGLTAELQLSFVDKKLSSAVLILGSDGLNDHNCISKYKSFVSLMNEKYGHFLTQGYIKDPVMDDLLFVGVCVPVQTGVYEIETMWKTKNFRITSALFGDEESIFIEVEYVYLSLEKAASESNRKKARKRL